jgi:hypothetical protein
MIPHTIHQFWHSNDPPTSIRERIATWQNTNPTYQHILWDDRSAATLLREFLGDDAVTLYRACQMPAMRADVLRAAALYFNGGVYVDADQKCMQPLDSLLDQVDQAMLYRVPGMIIEGKQTWRVRNDFMIGAPRARFFGALLTSILTNIRDPASNNVWSVTGPGALAPLLSRTIDIAPYRVKIIDRDYMFSFTHPDYSITQAGGEEHWSKRQEREAITKLDAPCSTAYEWANYVILGNSTTDTVALKEDLRGRDLDIGLERPGRDGFFSWWYTGFAERRRDQVLFRRTTSTTVTVVLPGQVSTYLCDPRHGIPNIQADIERNGRQNAAFAFRRSTLKRLYDIDIALLDELPAAVTCYALWTYRARELASSGGTPELLPATLRGRGLYAPSLDVARVMRAIPNVARPLMDDVFSYYGISA